MTPLYNLNQPSDEILMSYKHNNLIAMRENYWNDEQSQDVQREKLFLRETLLKNGVFQDPSLDDVKYVFFALPSIVIVKGYALGFQHNQIKTMIEQFIEENKTCLAQRQPVKIKFRL